LTFFYRRNTLCVSENTIEEEALKAAICYELGKPLVVEDITLDPPQKGEVKVKMAATAVCHSDIHFFKGELPGQPPFVGGHESAGWVDEVGEGVVGLKKGDPVVLSLLISCGKCKYCLTGRSNQCNATFPLDTETRMHNQKGQNLGMLLKTASFAEYTIVDQTQLVKIPADMPMDRACLLACGVITGYGAVVNRAKVPAGSSVVVIGTGGVGLNSIQGAAISGAYPIIAVDVLDKKLEAAKKFGATHVVNSAKTDAVKEIRALTGGEGADYVFVTVGSTAAIVQGVDMSAPTAMTVIVGLPKITDTVTMSPFPIIRYERIVTGGFMGSGQLHLEVPKMIALYKAGKLKLDELITGRFPLKDINKAIDQVVKGEALRNVITF
jgi:S-(hydroxymethyl)glutathione dehydrogenase/alcohol dehydrogenase